MKKFYRLLLLVALIVLGTGCVTKKKKSEVSFLGKVYHNTTARYNGYFNANELVKEAIFQLEDQNVDDYNSLLSIYPYTSTANVQSVAENMDEAIKKVTVVVSLHPQSHWVDDCYLLAGKAQYLKQDYESAEEMLRYMVNEFDPDIVDDGTVKQRASSGKLAAQKTTNRVARERARKKAKKERAKQRKKNKKFAKKKSKARKKYREDVNKARKKGKPAPTKPAILITEEEGNEGKSPEQIKKELEEKAKREAEENKDENYFLKHKPAFQEGVVWLARTLIERDNYEGALRYLAQLENANNTFDEIKAQIPLVKAYMFIKREQFNNAINPLQQAVALTNKRPVRGRYAFILGQLYQRLGDESNAFIAFEESYKLSTDYEMQFNCKLNMAQNAWLSGQGSSADAIAEIERMLKDERNIEYKDRLYYSLAQIALKENDRPRAIKNFRLSLKNGVGDKKQKAEAYIALANLYLEDEDYLNASLHFDSTLSFLPKQDIRYADVEKLNANLSEIATNLKVIILQDSLLQISNLSKEEQNELALNILKNQEQQRLNEIASKANNTAGSSRGLVSPTRNALQKESTFFAYDDRTLKRGQRDFENKWGQRGLEDNWRRSNNNRQVEEIDIAQAAEKEKSSNLSEEEINKVLSDVPKTDQDRASAALKIQEAMFNLGTLYRDNLQNNAKSIEILNELLSKYPETSFKLDAWYYLYLLHLDDNQPSVAKQYADLIIKNYPASTYAQVIKDPDYIKKLQDETLKLNLFYDRAYASFTDHKYQQAYNLATKEVQKRFGAKNELEPKFALLAAMCNGSLRGKPKYIEGLQTVVAQFPETPEATKAKEILRLLGAARSTLPGRATVDEDATNNYKIEENALHYLLVVFNTDVRLTDIQNEMSDYNKKYYQLEKFRYSQMFLGRNVQDGIPVLVVRRFKNKQEGMKYYEAISNSRDEFVKSTSDFDLFLVSQNNYRSILRSKSLAGYRSFFEKNYLQ